MNDKNDIFAQEFLDELSDVSLELGRIDDLAKGVASSLTKAFKGAIIDGKSLRSLLGDIVKSFADIALKAALKPIGTLAAGFIDNLFTASNPTLNPTPFAKGGVVGTPTYFPLNSGFGVAGEAGAEAILPLARGSDGKLGVVNNGGNAPINISMNISSPNAQSFLGAEAELSAMLLRAVKRGGRAS
jgi:phage-related minor tail protein